MSSLSAFHNHTFMNVLMHMILVGGHISVHVSVIYHGEKGHNNASKRAV